MELSVSHWPLESVLELPFVLGVYFPHNRPVDFKAAPLLVGQWARRTELISRAPFKWKSPALWRLESPWWDECLFSLLPVAARPACFWREKLEGYSQASSWHNVHMGEPRILRGPLPPRVEFLHHFAQIITGEDDVLDCQPRATWGKGTHMIVSTHPRWGPGRTPRWPLMVSLGILTLPTLPTMVANSSPKGPGG